MLNKLLPNYFPKILAKVIFFIFFFGTEIFFNIRELNLKISLNGMSG
jgi:hypothetical protein